MEFEALLLALRKMKALGQQNFIIRTDFKVIREHIEKESEAKNPVLMKYLEKAREMERHFKGYTVHHIPRDDNNEADRLAKAAPEIKKCLQMCYSKSSKNHLLRKKRQKS
jgi:ribonuclease HI